LWQARYTRELFPSLPFSVLPVFAKSILASPISTSALSSFLFPVFANVFPPFQPGLNPFFPISPQQYLRVLGFFFKFYPSSSVLGRCSSGGSPSPGFFEAFLPSFSLPAPKPQLSLAPSFFLADPVPCDVPISKFSCNPVCDGCIVDRHLLISLPVVVFSLPVPSRFLSPRNYQYS